MEKFFGNITMILAISMVFLGLVSQIRKNRREKKCGLSWWMVVLPLAVYISRVGYAVTIGSWYILIPDSFGAIFSFILLGQFFTYRKKQEV